MIKTDENAIFAGKMACNGPKMVQIFFSIFPCFLTQKDMIIGGVEIVHSKIQFLDPYSLLLFLWLKDMFKNMSHPIGHLENPKNRIFAINPIFVNESLHNFQG